MTEKLSIIILCKYNLPTCTVWRKKKVKLSIGEGSFAQLQDNGKAMLLKETSFNSVAKKNKVIYVRFTVFWV